MNALTTFFRAALLPRLLVGFAALGAGAADAALPVQHWTQPSGAGVWLIEAHGLPMVDVQIDFDAGSRRDPAAQAGLASVTALMSEKGVAARDGQPALDENQLGEAWADLGASLDAGAGADRMSFSLRTLTDPALLPRVVQLAARQIGEPAFPDAVWLRERARLSAAIRESNTRPATVAGRAFGQAVYGSHPYGYETTEESLARISVAGMRDAYARFIRPCRAKISIVGDRSREQADALAAALLARLPQAGGCEVLPPVAEVAPLAQAVTRTIPFATAAQAQVLIGQPGYKRSDPDFLVLLVGNYVLGGGGFASRLTAELREKRGLVYGAYTHFFPALHAGAFTLALQTKPDQAAQAQQVAREVLARFVAEGPTEAEVKAAKDYLIGGFPLVIDSNRKLLGNLSNIAWYGLPTDYLDTWTRRVERVTAAQIRAAFARVLQPDRMVSVVLGAPVAQPPQ